MSLFSKIMFQQTRAMIVLTVLAAFIGSSIQSPPVCAQMAQDPMPFMPKPGVMVHLSPEFTPAFLKGIVVHPENALKFDFIIYKGDKALTDAQKREEYAKLTKYFLASLAIPDDDQWVNLSPYEKDRIIKDDFGKTEMGRDLLAQDYMLKQITASLIYPEGNLGKKFWNKVYTQAQEQFGTTNIPVNTFNKVWILPDDALIYEKGNTAYVLKNHLRVMLEEDYLSLQKHSGITSAPITSPSSGVIARSPRLEHSGANSATKQSLPTVNTLGSKIVKEIVLPELEREVNGDKNFAAVRQVYSGMLLAAWYKRALKESFLNQIYANKAKVKGVDQDPKNNEQIYRQYLRAYKKGVFNFIKEDVDKYTNEIIPRKYFSGGTKGYPADPAMFARVVHKVATLTSQQAQVVQNELGNTDDDAMVNLQVPNQAGVAQANPANAAMTTNERDAARDIFAAIKVALKPYAKDTVIGGLKNGVIELKFVGLFKEDADARMRTVYSSDVVREALPQNYNLQWSLTEAGKDINVRIQITHHGKPIGADSAMTVPRAKGLLTELQGDVRILINHYTQDKPQMEQLARIVDMLGRVIAGISPSEKTIKVTISSSGNLLLPQMLIAVAENFVLDHSKNVRLNHSAKDLMIFTITLDQAMTVSGKNSKEPGPKDNSEFMTGVRQLAKTALALTKARRVPVTSTTGPIPSGQKDETDKAALAKDLGGIDMNAANLNLQIKRDGKGAPLPLARQDMVQLSRIQGLEPVIIEIKPAAQTPLFSQMQTSP